MAYEDPEEALFRASLSEGNSPRTLQDILDGLAIASTFAPVVGDVAGAAADINRMVENPEERTMTNVGLMGLGLLPFVPNAGVTSKLKDAGKKVVATTLHNLPNKLPNFYGGGVPGQIDSVARLTGRGLFNTAEQYLTPKGQAMLRDNVPAILPSVVKKQFKEAEEALANKQLKIDQINADSTLSADAKAAKIAEVTDETNKKVAAAGKIIEGQKGYSDLLNKGYGTSTPLIDKAMRATNRASGTFSADTFKQFFPDAEPGVFEKIAQNQGMIPGKGVLVERKASGQAAGDLIRDVHKKSHVADKINKAFAKQPSATNFNGYSSFREALDYGKLTPKQQELIDSPEIKKYLQSAFRGDSPLKQAKTAEEFSQILKNSGIKLPKALVDKAFRRTQRKPFADNAEMIAALEAEGLKILPENKARALEGGPLIVSDSLQSGALDLGGVGVVHVIKPNGVKKTYVNDENDLWMFKAPGAERVVSVASFSEDLLGPNALFRSGPLKSSGPAIKTEKPSPFHNMSAIQKKNAEEILNYNPEVTAGDYGRALKNNLLLGSGLAGLGNVFLEDEE